MATRIEQELAARLKREQKTGRLTRKDYLPAFMAARLNVMEAMAAGFALKIIWEHMNEIGRIPFRYETFLKYVRQHITDAPADLTTPSPESKAMGPAKRT
ncbi:TraK family protein [Xanthomonas perforans]|uniref:TraK family protein n=1 Tax=Xanthomonas perforans TaxID=442694 RepID=UPI00287EC1B7|nr:TraK family protein [Xanthomonas perforans]MDS6450612.1 TraK family protein [Xanthomonas perforans]MDS6459207.1 TraK family protein [Xanthomonas perforans]MDS6467199.1 TraK family protein [Xanthomonas perforans]MDS6476734.1 TraK family protein [Xanthomonas perforans]MDS6480650.1 TraK family protein [Xanthomonas perforans]